MKKSMKRLKRNVDEMIAYSDLLLYAILASLLVFFVCFHAICAFVITGFETGGFSRDWTHALSANLMNWGVVRWTIGVPLVIFIVQFVFTKLISEDKTAQHIEGCVCDIESRNHPGCGVVRIFDINRNAYLDALYEETLNMCRKANVRMPRLFYVNTPDLNGYTTTSGDGTHGIVLYRGLMDTMVFNDVKAVIAHEIGHIISKDVAYGKWIGYAIGTMTSFWLYGHILVKVEAEQLLHPENGDDPDPVAWIGGIMALVFGNVLIVLGGFSNFCGYVVRWMRDKQAEYIADSRGASLLENEQDFADMIIVLHCSSVAQCPRLLRGTREVLRSQLTCPGSQFATLDPHPDDIDRVRRIRPLFDGNFKRAYLEIVARRSHKH